MKHCRVTAEIDDYSAEQGRKDEREKRLEAFRQYVVYRLYSGESVCIFSGGMTLADVVNEKLDSTDVQMLADALMLCFSKRGFDAAVTTMKLLVERQNEMVNAWIDEHLETIHAAEFGDDNYDCAA